MLGLCVTSGDMARVPRMLHGRVVPALLSTSSSTWRRARSLLSLTATRLHVRPSASVAQMPRLVFATSPQKECLNTAHAAVSGVCYAPSESVASLRLPLCVRWRWNVSRKLLRHCVTPTT